MSITKEKASKKLNITDENSSLNKVIIALAIPTIFEQLSRIGAQYVDTAMVGQIGANATAAVGINSSTMLLINSIMTSVSTGFSILIAMKIGAGEKQSIRATIRTALFATLILGALMTVLMQVLGNYVPGWLGAEPDVMPDAVMYLRIVCSILIFQFMIATVGGILRAAGNMKVPFWAGLVANIVNIIGNFALIPETQTITLFKRSFTIYGAGLGVTGAALATAASMVVSSVILFAYLCLVKSDIRYHLKDGLAPDKTVFAPVARFGLPVLFERGTIALGQVLLTAMVANLGTIAMATHYVVNQVATLAYELSMGFSVASMTLTAQCTGAHKKDLAYRYMNRSLLTGVLLSVFFSTIVFIFSPYIISIFNSDPAVIKDAVFISRMDAVTEPLFAVSTVLCGSFRGYGDTKYPFLVSFVGIIITRPILGYILGYLAGIGLIGIWIGIAMDIVIRAVMCFIHMRKFKEPAVQAAF